MTPLPIILAQLAPGAAVETTLIAVPSTQKVRIAEIAVCNRVGTASSFRLSISELGAPTATKDYLYYDLPLVGNDTFAVDIDLTLNSLDVVRIYAATAFLTFTLIGTRT